MPFPYQNMTPKERKRIASSLRDSCPGYLPVLVDIPGRTNYRQRYMIHEETSISNLAFEIRKHSKINSSEAIYLFADSTILSLHSPIIMAYSRLARDGFLYVTVNFEKAFG